MTATTGFNKVLVVAMVPEETVRRHLEEQMAAQLQRGGVQATPSYQVHAEATPLTRESVKDVVERNGFDSVLVTQYLGTERELEYTPGTYYDYFGYWLPRIYEPGYLREVRTVKLESRFFDARAEGKMVWSAATSTVDPASVDRAIPSLARKIVDRLQRDVAI